MSSPGTGPLTRPRRSTRSWSHAWLWWLGDIWALAGAPGQAPGYLQLAWSLLLVAYAISALARPAARVTALMFTSAILAGAAVYLWNAAQAPEDWVNYAVAALLLLLLLANWLARRWARTGRA